MYGIVWVFTGFCAEEREIWRCRFQGCNMSQPCIALPKSNIALEFWSHILPSATGWGWEFKAGSNVATEQYSGLHPKRWGFVVIKNCSLICWSHIVHGVTRSTAVKLCAWSCQSFQKSPARQAGKWFGKPRVCQPNGKTCSAKLYLSRSRYVTSAGDWWCKGPSPKTMTITWSHLVISYKFPNP